MYDNEVAQFARKLASSGVIRSSIVTADVNALANAGNIVDSSGTTDTVEESDPTERLTRDEL